MYYYIEPNELTLSDTSDTKLFATDLTVGSGTERRRGHWRLTAPQTNPHTVWVKLYDSTSTLVKVFDLNSDNVWLSSTVLDSGQLRVAADSVSGGSATVYVEVW